MNKVAMLLAFVTSGCCGPLPQLAPKKIASIAAPAPQYEVAETYFVWSDAKRQRDVPAKIFAPRSAGRFPVVIFSHGIGEDRDSYIYLGRSLAQHGFVAVHITHAGTDRAVLERGYRHIYRSTKEPINWINRPIDVSFVIDQLASLPIADTSRVAVAGHSAGAFTGFAVATGPFRDPRVRALIPMSMPEIPGIDYNALAVPVLNMTGTCDSSIIYRTSPKDRRVPFDSTRATKQYLITFRGVNHNTFSNRDDEHHPLIAELTVLFARAWLLDDAQARAWFDDPGLTKLRGTELTLEKK